MDNVSKTMATKQQLDDLVEHLRAELTQHPKKVKEIESEAEMKHPNWDEWKRLKSECHSFDNTKAQFILVAGIVPSIETQYIGLLRKVKWHSVIDFDPDSETRGLHQAFSLNNDKQSLPDTWVPGRVLDHRSSDLASAINFLRLPWLFARGRTKDSAVNQPRESFQEWTRGWVSAIGRFLTVVAENLDAHRPVVTLILSFDGFMNDYIRKIFTRLDEELSPLRLSSAKHVMLGTGKAPSIDLESVGHVSYPVKRFHLPASLFSFGLAVCLGCSPKSSKSLPSGISGVPVFITNVDFLYYSEFLTLLYEGCENEEFGKNPDSISDDRRSEIIEEHKQAFLSGQTISFLSLNYDHDATRDSLEELTSNIYDSMKQKPVPPSAVIEIMHHPGTGGSTLARRTLWNLRRRFPAAIAKSNLSVHTPDEETTYVEKICERIRSLEELCFAAPLILIDGETHVFRRSTVSRAISDRLASHGSKAVILHCLRATESTESAVESFLCRIWLKSKLSLTERERFKDKYRDSLKSIKEGPQFCRSFHFPLCAFVNEFSSRMKSIVARTVDELDEVEIAVIRFVALMQKYTAQSVPLSLVFKLFLQEREIDQSKSQECRRALVPTYDEIYNSFTDGLRVLLVQSGSKWIRDHAYGTCDLQHVVVAESVLAKVFGGSKGESKMYYERMEQYLQRLLAMEILISVEKMYVRLFETLFLHFKEIEPRASFSLLVEELKKHLPPDVRVGKLLMRAASVFPSTRFYADVARYFVYSYPTNFELAEEMVASGFRAAKQYESKTILHEMRGLICRIRLFDQVKKREICTVEKLEKLAFTAIYNYNLAIPSPPSRPYPLLGKVQVWIKCLEWIGKVLCDGHVADVVRYLSTEATEFFRNILSESFHHLDIVEDLISSHTVHDVDKTQEKVIECKMKLSFVREKAKLKRGSSLTGQHGEVIAECEKLSKRPDVAVYSKREMRRLKVYYILNGDGNGVKLECLKPKEIRYLYQLLRELVVEEKDFHFAGKVFRVATYLPPQEPLSLDEAIRIAEDWKSRANSNPYAYFHSFVLYFLKVVYGGGVEYGAKYEDSLKTCVDLSYSFINRSNAIYYLRNESIESGLSALVERAAFKIGKSDDFWKVESRKTLLELEGRVRMKSRGRKRSQQKPEIFFELINSGIRIDVGRNQMQLSGQLGKDYQVDQLVKFVVSFSLRGPAAHGFVLESC